MREILEKLEMQRARDEQASLRIGNIARSLSCAVAAFTVAGVALLVYPKHEANSVGVVPVLPEQSKAPKRPKPVYMDARPVIIGNPDGTSVQLTSFSDRTVMPTPKL